MKQHVAVYFSLSYTVSSFEQRVEDAIRLLFDQLDQQFVAKGAHCDLTRWFKYFSYDAMGLMTFSRAYGHLQHGRDFSGIIAEVKKSMLAIGPVSCIPPTLYT
jgi:salicylate hydroxylase